MANTRKVRRQLTGKIIKFSREDAKTPRTIRVIIDDLYGDGSGPRAIYFLPLTAAEAMEIRESPLAKLVAAQGELALETTEVEGSGISSMIERFVDKIVDPDTFEPVMTHEEYMDLGLSVVVKLLAAYTQAQGMGGAEKKDSTTIPATGSSTVSQPTSESGTSQDGSQESLPSS